jgi:hypothetical protein
MSNTIRTEIVINASKEKVWSILTNFHDYPHWNPFIISIKGDLAINKKLINTMLNGAKTFVFKPKVRSVVPNKYFNWLGSLWVKGLFDGHHYFEIEELSPLQVKLKHGENFSGILSNYIMKKIGNETRSNFIKMNNAVKNLAEKQ